MIQEKTRPLNPLELLRIKKNPQTERERALLANLADAEADHAADIIKWQQAQVHMEHFAADANRKINAFVQLCTALAVNTGNQIEGHADSIKKVPEGWLYEIRSEKDGRVIFELKEALILVKKPIEENKKEND